MRLHHLALLTPNVDRLATFYAALLDAPEVRRQPHSVWLQLDGCILMIERGSNREGAIPVFAALPGSGAHWLSRMVKAGAEPDGRTEFSVYGRDPDGARFGLSSFPEPLG